MRQSEVSAVNLCENKCFWLWFVNLVFSLALKCKSPAVSWWPERGKYSVQSDSAPSVSSPSVNGSGHEAVLTDQIWACWCEMRPAAQKNIQKVKREEYNRLDQKKNLLKHSHTEMKVWLMCSVQTCFCFCLRKCFVLLSSRQHRVTAPRRCSEGPFYSSDKCFEHTHRISQQPAVSLTLTNKHT